MVEKVVVQTSAPHVIRKPLPPASFQPLKASAEELATFGLPKRPDAKLRPQIARFWETAAAQKLRVIDPKLIETDLSHQLLTNDVGSSLNWSGAIQTAPAGQSFDTVMGEWTVPKVELPYGAAAGLYTASIWVGLGGTGGTKSLLQAGTMCKFNDVGGTMSEVKHYAWFEWVPGNEKLIADLEVKEGDHIRCAVCVLSKTIGYYGIQNVKTGDVSVLTFKAPSGTEIHANSAEWIVERARVTKTGQLSLLPKIDGGVTFSNGQAGLIYGAMPDEVGPTNSAGEIGFSGATPLTMQNSDNVVLANTGVTNATVKVTTTKLG